MIADWRSNNWRNADAVHIHLIHLFTARYVATTLLPSRTELWRVKTSCANIETRNRACSSLCNESRRKREPATASPRKRNQPGETRRRDEKIFEQRQKKACSFDGCEITFSHSHSEPLQRPQLCSFARSKSNFLPIGSVPKSKFRLCGDGPSRGG
jgi:hypothetical protein